jgi:sec-independent protein translocase protein TatA
MHGIAVSVAECGAFFVGGAVMLHLLQWAEIAKLRYRVNFGAETAMHLGWVEIVLIVAIILLLFGGKKIPELMRGLGQGTREFKEGLRGDDAERKDDTKGNNKP